MKLRNEFEVSEPVEKAWPMLLDVENIAQCVPGGEFLGKLDDRSFKGRVSVKLGPVQLAFEGIAKFTEIDEVTHRARVDARGAEKKGRGTAQAKVAMQLEPDGQSTKVSIVTDLQLSGSVAQYGRASGLITEVSQQLVDEFSGNLNRQIKETAGDTAKASAEQLSSEVSSRSAPQPISGFEFAVRVLWNWLVRRLRRRMGSN